MASASHGVLGRPEPDDDDGSLRLGGNTAEVEAFLLSVAQLTPWQWRRVLATRRLVASVTKESADHDVDSWRSIQAAIASHDGSLSEPMARAGEALVEAIGKRTDDKVALAWQAVSALVMRDHLSALKFAAHYAPFAALVPVAVTDALEPATLRFVAAVEGLTADQCAALARPWRLEPGPSRALLRAVARTKHLKIEEAVALSALRTIPALLPGDAGWSAVRTAVHGARVLGRRVELSSDEVAVLWSPLQPAIPLESLDDNQDGPPGDTSKEEIPGIAESANVSSTRSRKGVPPARSRAPGPFGPNSAEVAAFVRVVVELTPIQWLRVLDRRKLVASVTRESSGEPAAVVRAMLVGIAGTRDLDTSTRCRVFAAVERAGFAVEARARLKPDHHLQHYEPFAQLIPADEIDSAGFASRLGGLGGEEWTRVASAVPAVDEDVIAPLVNAGQALVEFLAGRSDDEAVATWHAVSALVRRHHLTPIKFAASYAPFASAIPATSSRARSAMVLRYLTAVGRLGASQCELLARPRQLDDEVSNALSRVTADGSARPVEEAAAMAAVVTVPMRLAGSEGWAAVKTAAFGGRVIASRARLTPEQFDVLWRPIQAAIPIASLGSPTRSRR